MDMNLSKLQEMVKEREAWRPADHAVAKSQTPLSNSTATIQTDLGASKKKKFGDKKRNTKDVCTKGHREKATIFKLRRDGSGETKPANILILNF